MEAELSSEEAWRLRNIIDETFYSIADFEHDAENLLFMEDIDYENL